MTNSPGDGQPPQDPNQPPSGEQPGYWQQQSGQPGQDPYAQPPSGQQPYGQVPPAPYGQAPGYPMAYAPDHPRATTSLILGILGIVICGIIAPFAWRMGKRTVDEIDASHGQLGGRGSAQAGYILGIVGTILLGLGLLVVLGAIVLGVLGTVSSSSTTY
ncbi:hypothetical protein KRR39_16075 [Nocardioides panacis]|uniref:DUF4190 domain-containing protein n=1 Tax=Nocardioides panacis TaxID=2849501 RepID=A0A975SW44_9ACTN|nr:DUF4190 domain-containing protein [Nocardioides panacis]QWZ07015.1 hypothetical protein KRR39_16075 [Nocardioides panacis]